MPEDNNKQTPTPESERTIEDRVERLETQQNDTPSKRSYLKLLDRVNENRLGLNELEGALATYQIEKGSTPEPEYWCQGLHPCWEDGCVEWQGEGKCRSDGIQSAMVENCPECGETLRRIKPWPCRGCHYDPLKPPSIPDNKTERAPSNEPDIERLAEVDRKLNDAVNHIKRGTEINSTISLDLAQDKIEHARAILKELGYQGEGAGGPVDRVFETEYPKGALPGSYAFLYEFILEVMKRYEQHRPKKGDSWKDSSLDFLYGLLGDEYSEVEDLLLPDLTDQTEARSPRLQHPSDDFMSELVDLALVAAMCWAREGDAGE